MTRELPPPLERLASDPEKFPGALLLTGRSETDLERLSRRLAARLLCPGRDPEERCGSCRRVEAGLHPDFLSVDVEGLQIPIQAVRAAIAFGAGRPYEAARRIARVARAEMLGIEAANALLKSLEEPGERFRWILASSRPDLLLPTIRSRCVRVPVAELSPEDRARAWVERGFPEEDARDLVLFASEDEKDPAAALAAWRDLRKEIVTALEEGILGRRLAALLMLAEEVSGPGTERAAARLLSEILADAALAGSAAAADRLRHPGVGGAALRLGRQVSPETLRKAALAAADPPPDRRRGNRRLHYEALLLQLHRNTS